MDRPAGDSSVADIEHEGLRLPIASSGKSSAARVLDDWYVACMSKELDALGARPLSTTLYGLPIVVFRDGAGGVGALLDRCPHRNVPLSDGEVEGALLRCGYHGWAFDTQGAVAELASGTSWVTLGK